MPSWATCSCGQALGEDVGFLVDMAAYGLSTRRFVCPAGHSRYASVIDIYAHPPPKRYGSAVEPVACPECGTVFMPSRMNRVWCSAACYRIHAKTISRGRRR